MSHETGTKTGAGTKTSAGTKAGTGSETTGSAAGTTTDRVDAVLPSLDRRRLGLGVAGTAGFLAVWHLSALLVARPYLFPTPVAVASAFVTELTAPATLPLDLSIAGATLLDAELALTRMTVKLIQSLFHYLPGLVVGTGLGIGAGVAMGWSERLDAALTPVTRVLRPIPPLAWIAFAVVWIGVNHNGAVFIVAIGAFWINFYNAYSGVEGVPVDLREVAAALGVDSDLRMIRKVVLPAASPEIMTGIRTSIGQCWMIVVAAELFGAPGVGFQIVTSAQNLRLDISVAYMLVISLVFLASDGAFRRVEQGVLEWRA